jgi:thioredoxin 1
MTKATVVKPGERAVSSEALESSTPVIVYFWAEWCGPCKSIAPVLDTLAVEYEDRVRIVWVNIEEHPALATEYGVRAVPTLLLLHQGRIADQFVGQCSKFALEERLYDVMG